jgi:hypothetical protein
MTDKITFTAANTDVYCAQDSDEGSILFATVSGPSVEIRLPRESLETLRNQIELAFGDQVRWL